MICRLQDPCLAHLLRRKAVGVVVVGHQVAAYNNGIKLWHKLSDALGLAAPQRGEQHRVLCTIFCKSLALDFEFCRTLFAVERACIRHQHSNLYLPDGNQLCVRSEVAGRQRLVFGPMRRVTATERRMVRLSRQFHAGPQGTQRPSDGLSLSQSLRFLCRGEHVERSFPTRRPHSHHGVASRPLPILAYRGRQVIQAAGLILHAPAGLYLPREVRNKIQPRVGRCRRRGFALGGLHLLALWRTALACGAREAQAKGGGQNGGGGKALHRL